MSHLRRRFWSGLVGLIIGAVAGVALADVLFATMVLLLQSVGRCGASLGGTLAWSDPVYTRAAFHSLADITVAGLALGRANAWRLAGTVLTPGGSVLGRIVANSLAQTLVLVAALVVFRRGMSTLRDGMIAVSVGLQLEVAVGFVLAPITLEDLETIGLSFAINASIPSIAGRRLVVSDLVAAVPPSLSSAALVGVSLLGGYVLAGLIVAVGLQLQRRTTGGGVFSRHVGPRRPALRALLATTLTLIGASMLVSACGLPAGALAAPPSVASHADVRVESASVDSRTSSQPITESLPQPAVIAAPKHFTAADRWYVDAAPKRVEVVSRGGSLRYVVDGRRR